MLSYFFLLYLVLARVFKIWSKKVQIHSIVHCVVSFLWTTYALFISTGESITNIHMREILSDLSVERQLLYNMVVFHSMGYFMADIVDIIIDHTNDKRRIYLLHHVVAIAGLSTVYLGSYISIYPIWALEIGGIVHHLKHASEVYNFGSVTYILVQGLYHVVYVFSRVLLALNIYDAFTWICHSNTAAADLMGLSVACVLLVQNFVWWGHNAKKSLAKLYFSSL